MMSFAKDGVPISDGEKAATWTGVKYKLICWTDDTDEFDGVNVRRCYYTFNIMAGFRQPDELLILFTSLPPGWEKRADGFNRCSTIDSRRLD